MAVQVRRDDRRIGRAIDDLPPLPSGNLRAWLLLLLDLRHRTPEFFDLSYAEHRLRSEVARLREEQRARKGGPFPAAILL